MDMGLIWQRAVFKFFIAVVWAAALPAFGPGAALAQELTNVPERTPEELDIPSAFERDIIGALERMTSDALTSNQLTRGDTVTQERDPDTGQLLPSFIVQRRIDAQGGSRVPILVPFIWTYNESVARTNGFKIKATPTNYTAIFRPPSMPGQMDVVIDGSVAFYQSEKRIKARTSDSFQFDTLGEIRGGSITFSKFGASYLVTFYCRDGLSLDETNCITESAARGFVLRELLGEDQ